MITLKDLKWASDIELITKRIYKIYNNLSDLEKRGERKTQEYQIEIEKLNIALSLEKRLYDKIINTPNILLMHTAHFKKRTPKDQQEEKILTRIIYSIKRIIYDINKKEELSKSKLTPEKRELLKNRIDFYRDTIDSEYYLMREYFLEEFINQQDYEPLKNELIDAKYNNIFECPVIEKYMLENNFNLPEIYRILNLVSDILANDKNLKICISEESWTDQTLINIAELLYLKDEYYANDEIKVMAILFQCKIRASLLILDAEQLDIVITTFYNVINNPPSYLKNKVKISTDQIINIFNNLNKDRAKFYEVSGPKRK